MISSDFGSNLNYAEIIVKNSNNTNDQLGVNTAPYEQNVDIIISSIFYIEEIGFAIIQGKQIEGIKQIYRR